MIAECGLARVITGARRCSTWNRGWFWLAKGPAPLCVGRGMAAILRGCGDVAGVLSRSLWCFIGTEGFDSLVLVWMP